MLITEEYVRDWLPVCSRETDRRRSVLAIAGKDCAITLVSRCWESLGLNVNSATWQQRFGFELFGFFLRDGRKGKVLLPAAGLLCSALGQTFLHHLLPLFSHLPLFASFELGC